MPNPENHPDDELLVRYAAGRAMTDEQLRVDEHIGACSACLRRVRALDRLREDFDVALAEWTMENHRGFLAGANCKIAAAAVTAVPPATETPREVRPVTAAPGVGKRSEPVARNAGGKRTPWRFGWLAWGGLALGAGAVMAVIVWLAGAGRHGPEQLARLRDTGGEAVLFADGSVRIAGVSIPSAEWSERIARAWRDGVIHPLPALAETIAEVRGASVVLDAGGPGLERPVAQTPVGGAVRADGRAIRLQWRPMAEATRQSIVVNSQDGGEWSMELAGAVDHVVIEDRFLLPGQRYTWQIEATALNGVGIRLSEPAAFFVLPAEVEAELGRLERAYAGSAVALAIIYDAHGFRDDALAQLDRLSTLNPADPAIARLRAAIAG